MIWWRAARAAALLAIAAVPLAHCTSPQPDTAVAGHSSTLTPVLSVKELMEHIIDPAADSIFDAAVVDVTAAGVHTTLPTTDEDWLRIERALLLLAEAPNLLKIDRPIAPPGEGGGSVDGKPAPELSPPQIAEKVNGHRELWNRHADDLRDVALASLPRVRAKDADGVFQIGSDIDKACENCHLDFWYPGDRAAVRADQKKTVTYGK